ncbi:MAG: hypothetical protein DCC67_19430 [Planctomycetota bacterium]|nr:MAG: hypothetical protein DCC67_19430 [Planctomycetota bacterium]
MQVDGNQTLGEREVLHEHARLLPTLVGALIGAAVGVGLHLLIETGIAGTRPYEAIWFAMVIGLITGFGVRLANKGHMGRSYARGAISGFVALGAIVLSTFLISTVMAKRDALAKSRPAAAAAQADAGKAAPTEGDAAAADAAPTPMEAAAGDRGGVAGVIGRPNDKLNPWQFIFMAVGAFIAYELGRGVEHRRPAATAESEPVPATEPT